MQFKEILKRINGVSTAVFGVSWNPTGTDRDHAREILAFLEDRRVLYVPSEMEMPSHCVQSVIAIREFLTEKIGLVPGAELQKILRAMRAACRKFLRTVETDDEILRFGSVSNHRASWVFNGALGEMRGVFGIHLAQIAAMHGLAIEDDLAAILPAKDID